MAKQNKPTLKRITLDEKKADSFIEKGGTPVTQKKKPVAKPKSRGGRPKLAEKQQILLRLFTDEVNKIDAAREKVSTFREVSRQDWIIQAIAEKLERE